MSFDTILIANRGEIACRVIRTARDLGLRTVAVYSEADAGAPHVKQADAAVCIGGAAVAESYLNADAILQAAAATGAGAIHPGYGFLSENADFAEAVAQAGVVFIGPPAAAIRDMGDKAAAKRLMINAGVPCVPGYQGDAQDDATLIAAASDIGFPVMVKASAGGGGRGMRLVDDAAALSAALGLARAEAKSAFGSDMLIIEKAVLRPRHVEVQVFADRHGACIHLGERDCSVQRRHQKVVEEAPCPVMTDALRAEMGAAAVAAAQAVDYVGAGTVEFLLDDSGAFYFLEMNTRLQVEHPVTEMITGLDLVALQIAVARGEHLPLSQDDVVLNGHAIEVRLYAEDPANDFLPSIGAIDLWHPATGAGVRIDAGIETGGEVSPFYDPMLAKVIAHGETREIARTRLIRALEDTVLFGPVTNTAFLADVLGKQTFARGEATTAFIADEYPDGVCDVPASFEDAALAAALLLQRDREKALRLAGDIALEQLGWSSDAPLPVPIEMTNGETVFALTAIPAAKGWLVKNAESATEVSVNSSPAHIVGENHVVLAIGPRRLAFRRSVPGASDEAAAGGRVTAPMPGLVVSVAVTPGTHVEKSDVLAVLEAMKMQHQIEAPVSGIVTDVAASEGGQLKSGDLMFEIEPTAEE
ncbi:MAG: acetyl/propionyl/methylcrotonyl-CoA carboxylase subunit alpha [Pikeienuella sp.]